MQIEEAEPLRQERDLFRNGRGGLEVHLGMRPATVGREGPVRCLHRGGLRRQGGHEGADEKIRRTACDDNPGLIGRKVPGFGEEETRWTGGRGSTGFSR